MKHVFSNQISDNLKIIRERIRVFGKYWFTNSQYIEYNI